MGAETVLGLRWFKGKVEARALVLPRSAGRQVPAES